MTQDPKHKQARARLRAIRDTAAAALSGSYPLASALLSKCAVVYGLLNGAPTFFLFPPAEGFVITEGYPACRFGVAELALWKDDEVVRVLRDWVTVACDGGYVTKRYDGEV